MAFAGDPFIAWRRGRGGKASVKDLMHEIVSRKLGDLTQFLVAVIGDKKTGRHTLLRRFRDMNFGPFRLREDSDNRIRPYILVELGDREFVIGTGMICMRTAIYDLKQLDSRRNLEFIREFARTFVVIFDVGRGDTLETAVAGMDKITALFDKAPEFVLVGNKIDLPRRVVTEEVGREVAQICKAGCYYECSALMNLNMEPVLDAVLIIGLNQFVPLPR